LVSLAAAAVCLRRVRHRDGRGVLGVAARAGWRHRRLRRVPVARYQAAQPGHAAIPVADRLRPPDHAERTAPWLPEHLLPRAGPHESAHLRGPARTAHAAAGHQPLGRCEDVRQHRDLQGQGWLTYRPTGHDHESGSRTVARRPGPASPRRTEPPWASAVDPTIARPRPAPSSPVRSRAWSRRAKRPKARSASSAGIPGPSSATVSTAHPPSSRTDTQTRLAACLTALSSRFTSSLASASASPSTTHGPAVSARTGTRAVA